MITITIEATNGTDLRRQLADLLGADKPDPKKDPVEKSSPPIKPPAQKLAVVEEAEPAAEEAEAPIKGEVLPADEVELDIDALKGRFEALVIDDYDKAEALIDELGVDNFAQAIAAGKEQEVADRLAAIA